MYNKVFKIIITVLTGITLDFPTDLESILIIIFFMYFIYVLFKNLI